MGGMTLGDGGLEEQYRRCRRAPLTYAEVGATKGALPRGYHHLERRVRIGSGEAAFERSRAALWQWAMQRRAGFEIYPPDTVPEEGVTLLLVRRVGPLRIVVPGRVVWTVDDAGASGFAYGTLPGHPERGEEAFLVERDHDGDVWAVVRAFSRHATWYARLGGFVAGWVQRRVTELYLDALRSP